MPLVRDRIVKNTNPILCISKKARKIFTLLILPIAFLIMEMIIDYPQESSLFALLVFWLGRIGAVFVILGNYMQDIATFYISAKALEEMRVMNPRYQNSQEMLVDYASEIRIRYPRNLLFQVLAVIFGRDNSWEDYTEITAKDQIEKVKIDIAAAAKNIEKKIPQMSEVRFHYPPDSIL